MPYSLPTPSAGRPTHRRSYTHSSGAFASLGSLPRVHRPVFHIQNDCSSDDDDHGLLSSPPKTLRLDTRLGVPFPRSSPSPRSPSPDRTNSTPVLLSNGRPLKSSLKGSPRSSSVPDMPSLSIQHTRARSAPSTPALSSHESHCHKNVHFPTHQLETVRVFNRSAKPASLLRTIPASDAETETETEVEGSSRHTEGPRFPFPLVLPSYSLSPFTDIVPSPTTPREGSNVILESLTLPQSTLALKGTLLVRNISYEKQVYVRFTLDDWQTTSEVAARYQTSLPSLPILSKTNLTIGDLAAGVAAGGPAVWDRFEYTIKLEDYASSLIDRTIFLVARYSAGGGEWWDNNAGKNYRVAFVRSPNQASPSMVEKTHAPVKAPFIRSSNQAPPSTVEIAHAPVKAPVESSVPFPTLATSSPLSPLYSTTSTPSLSPASSPLPTVPVPPPQYNRAQSEATLQHRLKGFKLANYAKPNAVPTQLSPTSEKAEGAGVFWFWGSHKPQTGTSSPVHSDGDGDVTPALSRGSSSPLDSPIEERANTLEDVPVYVEPAGLPVPFSMLNSDAIEPERKPRSRSPSPPLTPTPLALPLHSPSPPPGTPSPPPISTPRVGKKPPSPPSSSEDLYKAFLKQWCFVGAAGGAGETMIGA
ncbi:putative phosphatase regulatory subunit-domain-containing protein [Armillaria luteobubalina]|uniref:Phosphatase regulatory subunit-domain-containing protein n=1 Tax=Armillaria luteobubalina TaxID=153913 RepID=A0AA39US36_9AGAR|nr:putative phosphatase regulatory subunit-domain-containing protein [Armillaria luteobubalina]